MGEVRRWDLLAVHEGRIDKEEEPDGDWVTYEDAAALEAQIAELESQLTDARSRLCACGMGHYCESEVARFKDRITGLQSQLTAAESIVQQWCHSAGWATGHGDTLEDILREMMSQHWEERSELRAELDEWERVFPSPDAGTARRMVEDRRQAEDLRWIDLHTEFCGTCIMCIDVLRAIDAGFDAVSPDERSDEEWVNRGHVERQDKATAKEDEETP